MPKLHSRLPLAFLPLFYSAGTSADVYKYVDRDGHVYYTDKPDHSGYSLIIKTPAAFSTPVKITFRGGNRLDVDALGPSRWRSARRFLAERNRRRYQDLIDAVAQQHGLDPALLHAVIQAESGYDPEAVSPKGAMGLMQLMPATALRYGVQDPYDPQENLVGGARYLSDLIEMFGSDIRLAVAAYNAGENNVLKYGYQVPPFPETQEYVSRVLAYYNRF
ncbi:transglycosylase SLT domain-containing protein [Candidatus Methylocalor cossyra]|uniref:Transglycosylase SLT domain-containing protein n=1 Tax=Candidatus Methylocalor cossyra TaxID=3108543 RepID=A0ABM9NFW3_9GAMM